MIAPNITVIPAKAGTSAAVMVFRSGWRIKAKPLRGGFASLAPPSAPEKGLGCALAAGGLGGG